MNNNTIIVLITKSLCFVAKVENIPFYKIDFRN